MVNRPMSFEAVGLLDFCLAVIDLRIIFGVLIFYEKFNDGLSNYRVATHSMKFGVIRRLQLSC